MSDLRDIGLVAVLGNPGSVHIRRWLALLQDAGVQAVLASMGKPSADAPLDVPFVSLGSAPRSLLDFVRAGFVLRRELAARGVTVVNPHYATNYGLAATIGALRRPDARLVTSVWGSDVHAALGGRGPRARLLASIVRLVLRRSTVVTCESAALAGRLVQRFGLDPDSVAVVRPWVVVPGEQELREAHDRARRALQIPNSAVVVCAPRGLRPVYQPGLVSQGLQGLLAHRDDVYVIILRGTSSDTEVNCFIWRYSALLDSPRCRFIPRLLSSDEFHDVLAASDVLVSFPLQDSLSVAVLEGLGHGNIPVLSDVPANRELAAIGFHVVVSPTLDDGLRLAVSQVSTGAFHAIRQQNRKVASAVFSRASVTAVLRAVFSRVLMR